MSKYSLVKATLPPYARTYNIFYRSTNQQFYIRKKINGKDTAISTPFFNDRKNDLTKLIKKYHAYEEECYQKRKELDSKITLKKLNTETIVLPKVEVENTITYPTFKEWGDIIIDDIYANYKSTREKERGRSRLNKLNRVFGNKFINEITISDVENWRNDWYKNSGLASSTINKYKYDIFMIFEKAVKSDLIARNPVQRVPNTKMTKITDKSKKKDEYGLPMIYNYEQIINLIDGCDHFIRNAQSETIKSTWRLFKALITTGFFSGTRTNELLALKWSDFNYEDKTIKLQRTIDEGIVSDGTKSKHYRTTVLLPIVEETLAEFKKTSRKSDDYLFINKLNKTYSNAKNLNKLFKKLTNYCKYEKLDLYNMRHSFITLMFSIGKDTQWILQRVGHSDILTTQGHYIGTVEERPELLQKIFEPNKTISHATQMLQALDTPISVSGHLKSIISTEKLKTS